jgi:hypothetical protein
VEHLRLIMGELHVADVRTQIALSLATDFENFQVLTPAAHHADAVTAMLDELLAWGGALKTLRDTWQAEGTAGAA